MAAARPDPAWLADRYQRSDSEDDLDVIPERYRQAIRTELDALTKGERSDLLLWVRAYPAALVHQPEEVWEHPWSDVLEGDDGTAHVVLPLWTVDESPSDLSAEIEIDAEGNARIADVHVL